MRRKKQPASGPGREAKEELLTYADYCSLPEDGKRYEVIGGQLYNAPAPFVPHQGAVANLSWLLQDHCRANKNGRVLFAPLDVVFTEIDVVQPDIIWISDERAGIIAHENVRGAPDLIVEVLSPSTKRKDRIIKKKLYGRHGVREYWVVDTDTQTLEVHRRRGQALRRAGLYCSGESLASRLFPGLAIAVRDIFS